LADLCNSIFTVKCRSCVACNSCAPEGCGCGCGGAAPAAPAAAPAAPAAAPAPLPAAPAPKKTSSDESA
jgi:hypothetical protein